MNSRAFTLAAVLLLAAAPASARLPSEAPPLPPPDPGVFTIVEVDTAQELADACWNLASDTAIVIAPGGDQGAARVRLYHVRLFDAGQQVVKGSGGPDDVAIECSEVFLTAGAVEHPERPRPPSTSTARRGRRAPG